MANCSTPPVPNNSCLSHSLSSRPRPGCCVHSLSANSYIHPFRLAVHTRHQHKFLPLFVAFSSPPMSSYNFPPTLPPIYSSPFFLNSGVPFHFRYGARNYCFMYHTAAYNPRILSSYGSRYRAMLLCQDAWDLLVLYATLSKVLFLSIYIGLLSSHNIIPRFLPSLQLEFSPNRGNGCRTEVANRLGEFTWNLCSKCECQRHIWKILPKCECGCMGR